MAQVNFKNDEFHGVLHFNVRAIEYEDEQQLDVLLNGFNDFTRYMSSFHKGDFDNIFKTLTVESLELTGISFTGRQDTERFSVDITDGWKRATIIFDEKKFGDLNIDKMKRIKKIIEE